MPVKVPAVTLPSDDLVKAVEGSPAAWASAVDMGDPDEVPGFILA